MKSTLLLSAFLLPLVLTGCVTENSSSLEMLQNQSWTLSRIDGGELQLTGRQKAPNLQINQDLSASGYAGCNNFTGQVQLEGHQLRVEKMALTRKMCFGDVMETEQVVSQTLSTWSDVSITKKNELILKNDGHQLVFESISH
ncbi:META domain-containing protein [Vibrio parahaemolyticus]|nr:META domain-containing protein [Vibrio parahaemolyticus]EIA1590714.1 META domain-containing protein [Vibrio parahaemolyticus]EIA1769075.1 META domain-containing protein [Vibrio parahaemolyticus]EJE8676085.1 META domain-containing protein [Vibrio parahaemolyticus]